MQLVVFHFLKVSVKKLAIQSIGIFAEIEKASFEKRTILLLPQLKESIKPEICNDVSSLDLSFYRFTSIMSYVALAAYDIC